MDTKLRCDGGRAAFLLIDVPASYEAAVRRLGFEPDAEGFARYFAVESAHLERSYATFARCAQEMILQDAGEHTVPWEDTLALIARLMAEHAIGWWLVGSVALAARGLDVQPGDVDLVVDEEGSAGLTEALLDSLVEPIRPITTWSAKVDGRAFLGARVEWTGGVAEGHPWGAAGPWETVTWKGYHLRVPPLAHQLVDAEWHNRPERVALISRALQG